MSSRGKYFHGSASVSALAHPWLTTSPWQSEGIYLGTEMRTGRVVFVDFQLLKKLQIIHSAVVLVTALKDHGKSALVKSLTNRLLTVQAGSDDNRTPKKARARLHDRKPNNGRGEYSPLADYLLAEVVKLIDQGGINIFDTRMGMNELDMIELAIYVKELISNEKISPWGTVAIQVAIYSMITQYSEKSSPAVLESVLYRIDSDEIDSYFDKAESGLQKEVDTRVKDGHQSIDDLNLVLTKPRDIPYHLVMAEAREIGAIFGRLQRADYGHLFGGTRSLRGLLIPQMTNFDWTGVTGKPGELLEAIMHKWDTIALTRQDWDISPHLVVGDEAHSKIKNLKHARYRDEMLRKARAYDRTDITVTQFATDLTKVGDVGSEIRGLGQSIYNSIGIHFVGKQPNDDDILHGLTKLGYSDADAKTTTVLPMGCWSVSVPGQKPVYVQHNLLPNEKSLVETNTANIRATNRILVGSIPEIQQRAKKLGLVQIGVS